MALLALSDSCSTTTTTTTTTSSATSRRPPPPPPSSPSSPPPLLLLLLILLLAIPLPGTEGIRITEMRVPRVEKVGATVKLACRVDLEGASLYSLNWWRGSEQFYQFSPSSDDQITVWESPGITVDKGKSERDLVVLHNISHATSGNFKCEVLADHPSFEKDSEITHLEVIDEPKHGPKVSLERLQWSPGEVLNANCTSPGARPPSEIDWFINGQKIGRQFTRVVEGERRGMSVGGGGGGGMGVGAGVRGARGREGLSRTSLLTLTLRQGHFAPGGQAVLSCDASYKKAYHRTSKVHLMMPGYKTAAPSQKLTDGGPRAGGAGGGLLWLAVAVVLAAFTL